MHTIMTIVAAVASVGTLVCFIMVVVTMFQKDATKLGIISLVLTPCFGIGPLIAFIAGWMNADKWGIRQLMLIYTVCVAIGVVTGAGRWFI
jgi:hypothetical protein